MIRYLILILAVMTAIFGIPIFIKNVIQYIKYKTRITKLIGIIFYSFGSGIIWESYRITFFLLFGGFWQELDNFFFISLVFFIFVGIYCSIKLTLNFSEQSGHKARSDIFINFFYFLLIPILSIINYYTFKTITNELGFNNFQVHPIMIILMCILYIPLALLLYIKYKTALNEIKNKETIRLSKILVFFMLLIPLERIWTIAYSYYVPNNALVIMYNLILINIYIIGIFIVLFKHPDFLESISTYFSFQTLYIIKNNGDVIFGYDFQKDNYIDVFESKSILLGGLMYILTHAIEQVMEKGKVEHIKMGNLTVLINYSKHVFGSLLSIEYTPIIKLKFTTFVKKFEEKYENQLTNWNGNISRFTSNEKLLNLLYEIFR